MENEIIQDVMALHGGGIERMLNESPEKRNRLKKSVKESKDGPRIIILYMQQDNRNPYLSHTVCGGSLIFVLILLSAVFVHLDCKTT